MKLEQLTRLTNLKLADELLSYVELLPYFNMVIDDINAVLNAQFPSFPEPPLETDEYTAIPDKYIRTVVIPGAAYKYYVVDEEGVGTAPVYADEYNTNTFLMLRDYLPFIPEEYQADVHQGSVRAKVDDDYGDRGLELNGYDFTI